MQYNLEIFSNLLNFNLLYFLASICYLFIYIIILRIKKYHQILNII